MAVSALNAESIGDIRTVDPFLICKALSLLCLIPIYNQFVPESEGSPGVGSTDLKRQDGW